MTFQQNIIEKRFSNNELCTFHLGTDSNTFLHTFNNKKKRMIFCKKKKLFFFRTWVRSTICSKLLWWWGHQSMCKQWYYLPRERRKPSDFAQKCHQLTDTSSFNSKVELPNKTTLAKKLKKKKYLLTNSQFTLFIFDKSCHTFKNNTQWKNSNSPNYKKWKKWPGRLTQYENGC